MDKPDNKLNNIPKMLLRLDEMYERQDNLKRELHQITEDIELLETLIMYQSNKQQRMR